MTAGQSLLAPDEPPPVASTRLDGGSPFVLVCDHAGRRLPASLGRLGLPEPEFDRHIAYDIGAAAVARALSESLDAALVEQRYSRLVIDCNRPPEMPSSVPDISETTTIPGNVGIGPADRAARIEEVFRPYHAAIEAVLDARRTAGRPTILVAVHSFTPVYKGVARPWHIGTLYGRDGRLAGMLRAALAEDPALVVGDNEPYAVSDATDYTIPVHGERRGLVHTGIEIRQDLIAGPSGQAEWAAILGRALPAALSRLQARPD
ncbi:MAG: N-formylglutamate amidohydrolase [Enterovirga sp.]|nr:N-formylglutamate amidohydrolase [Enterovirga sp.]